MAVIFLSVAVMVAALIVAWNFVPAFREKLRGWTTLFDTVAVTGLYIFDQVTQGLQEAVKAGWVPKELVAYLPLVFFAWVILKRFSTKTPVGKP